MGASVLTVASGSSPAPVSAAPSPLPPGFHDVVAFSGLVHPTAVRFAPGGRVFVAEKSGLIKTFDGLDDPTPTVFADLRTTVHSYWDRGLLGLALDPDFADTPFVYVSYTFDAPVGGTAPRWGDPGATADPCPTPPGPTDDGCVVTGRVSRLAAGGATAGPEQVLVEDWCQQFPSHSMGSIVFGRDGALYMGAGDGASFTTIDRGQLGGSEGSPTPRNPCGDPPREGGSLRSQDLRTMDDPIGYNGAIIRIDRTNGDALPMAQPPGAPSAPTGRAARIVATGLRNPFRITMRPGTDEIWIGDVGFNEYDEIDRLVRPAATPLENFGWPCYEGPARMPQFDALDLPICERLYAAGGTVKPWFTYRHRELLSAKDHCSRFGGATAGIVFASAEEYPAPYRNALFIADYSRRCIWMMPRGADGLPNRSAVASFHSAAAGPVDLQAGPRGDLFYVDFDGGTVRRIVYRDPIRFLSDLSPSAASNGFGPMEEDMSNGGSEAGDGGPLRLAGVRYIKGLGVHARSQVTYALQGCQRFRARIGIDDEVGAGGSVVFTVHADGLQRYRSPVMRGSHASRGVDLDMTGVSRLRLSVETAGDGNARDHADWAAARVLCSSPPGARLFRAVTLLPVHERPHSVAAADLNGDGARDLVTANAATDTVNVLLGRGDGTFRPKVAYATGDKPKGVVVARMNGDDVYDLVTAEQDGRTFSVLLGNGDGTFRPRRAFATCVNPHEVAVADLDGDVDRDVVMACGRGTVVSVHLSRGDGTFSPRHDYQVGTQPRAVVIHDLDEDGALDLAVAVRGTDRVSVLRGHGNGAFRPAVHYATGNQPHSVRVGDLDRDGNADLVVANDGGDSVSVLLGRGDATFLARRTFPAGRVPKSVAVGDLNGDGRPDVVAANVGVNGDNVPERPGGDRVSVLLGDGAGGLGPPAQYIVGIAPWQVIIADLDGDTWPDIATADFDQSSVGILRNTGDTGVPADAAPVATIDAPHGGTTWAAGDEIEFEGSATDAEDGPLGPGALSWDLVLHHCPYACHPHVIQSFSGRSGSFVTPDHEYPSHLELRLTATDSTGHTDVRSVTLPPRTATIRMRSDPAGLSLALGSTTRAAPFDRKAIIGSTNSVGAASPQTVGGATWEFAGWSDGGARNHEITAPAGGLTLIATFERVSGLQPAFGVGSLADPGRRRGRSAVRHAPAGILRACRPLR